MRRSQKGSVFLSSSRVGIIQREQLYQIVRGLIRRILDTIVINSQPIQERRMIRKQITALDIYPASRIARKCNAKLVYEVHDLWPLTPMELGGMSPLHPFIILMQRAENLAYKSMPVERINIEFSDIYFK